MPAFLAETYWYTHILCLRQTRSDKFPETNNKVLYLLTFFAHTPTAVTSHLKWWLVTQRNNYVTPWRSAFLKRQEFPQFYEPQRLNIVLTRVRHLFLYSVKLIKSMRPPPISLRTTLIISSYPDLGLPNGFSLPVPLPRPRKHFSLLTTCLAHLTLLHMVSG
jgi:hypothetical protein